MQNDRRGGRPDDAASQGGEGLRRAEDELEQARVALEDARAEAEALARERDAGAAELLRRTVQLREAEARLRAREDAAAMANAALRAPAGPGRAPEAETEMLRSALEEVQVLAEELGEANAALQRSNDDLDRTVARRTAALADANARLRRAEERQRLILESAADYAIFATDPSGRILSWNAGARNLLGWTAEEATGMDSAAIFTPEDRAADAPAEEMRRAIAEGRAADERWHVRRDGSRFWGDGLLMLLRGDGEEGGTGGGGGFLKVLRDRTERRRAEERQALLLGELNHRVKNTLALVLAMVDQTWRAARSASQGGSAGDETARAFHEGLRARLRALARAHDLLVQDHWEGSDMATLVAATTAAHGGAVRRPKESGTAPAIRASGPLVRLTPEISVALAMALHELATNAAKYGSLSVPNGRVDVFWSVAAGGPSLELSWTEHGGPPIEAPPTRRGFGSSLLERGLARQLGGEVVLDYAREGLRCLVRLPLSERVAAR